MGHTKIVLADLDSLCRAFFVHGLGFVVVLLIFVCW